MVPVGGVGVMLLGVVASAAVLATAGLAARRRLGWVSALAWAGLAWSLVVIALVTLVPADGVTGVVPAEGRLATCSWEVGGPAPEGFWIFQSGQRLLNTVLFVPAGALLVVSGAFGWAQDRGLWGPLRKRGTGIVAMMIVSIGLSIFLRSIFQYLVGGGNHNYSQYSSPQPWRIGEILITPKSVVIAALALAVLVAASLALQRTRIGKATRAVADNPALASASGINVERVIRIVWIGGAALAGLSGVLLGLTQGFNYQLGFKMLLLVFAAVTLGGLGTIWGALAGSFVIGILIEVSTIVVPAELKYVSALVVLIVVLVIRPQGLLGRSQRVG